MFNKENYLKLILTLGKETKLLAATKTKPKEDVLLALEAGVRLFGENYIQEAEEKYAFILSKVHEKGGELHLIGHLQSNKAKKAVELFDCIETIDSEKIAKKVGQAAVEHKKIMKVMIEVNFESQKPGIAPSKVHALAQKIMSLKNLQLVGLMGVPKIGDEEKAFLIMQELKKNLGVKELSIGMSNDYQLAIKHGSTIVRIGTMLFGEREKKN